MTITPFMKSVERLVVSHQKSKARHICVEDGGLPRLVRCDSSNRRFGMLRLILSQYSVLSRANAQVSMLSAEQEKGLRPVKRIRCQ